MDKFQIIKRPVISERSTDLKTKQRKIVLSVHRKANKPEIKKAVEDLLNIKVAAVNTANYCGKPKRLGRYAGRRAHWKKAIVTLKEGERTDIFEL